MAQASLRICAVLPEPLLFAHIKYEVNKGSGRKVPYSHELAQYPTI